MRRDEADEARLVDRLSYIAYSESGERGVMPKRWSDDPTWRCPNLHVSKKSIKPRLGRRFCSFELCHLPVYLTFPGDRSGPLMLPGALEITPVRVQPSELPVQAGRTRRKPYGLYLRPNRTST